MSEALLAQAVRHHQAGNLGEAARLYAAVLNGNPRHFQALYLLGFVRLQEGRHDEAERLIGEAVNINPASPDAFYNRGCALAALQRHGEAILCFDRAITLKPDYLEALINRGAALMALKRHHGALSSFDRALALKADDPEALSNRATVLFELRRFAEAAADYAKLAAAVPGFPYAKGNLALARAYCCDWGGAAAERAELSAAIRAGRPAIAPHGSTLILDDPEDQLKAARRWVKDRCPPLPPLWRGERYAHDRIRLAYLSADFHNHATAFLIAGVFERHDRSRFAVNLVSFGPDDRSAMRARLMKSADRFIDVAGKSDAEIAGLVRQMEIDIAVDLKGYTQDGRPGILARRPAPVQVNYLGHPGTMGADYIDYVFADETVIPPAHQRHYSEKVVYLPDSYQANDDRRRIADTPVGRAEAGLPEEGFVFCCFNSSYKITPFVFDVWMRLLASVEGSVLWLLEDNPAAVANLKREAEARGVSANRLVFAPKLAVEEHLARHRLADLFLDTLPCTAHTTASDALWAGLPLLTVLGTTFAGRVAASLLKAVGLHELVAASLQDYEHLALKLARDPKALSGLKARLVRNRQTAPLFDTERFTRNLERAFSAVCERQRRGERPCAFAVSAAE